MSASPCPHCGAPDGHISGFCPMATEVVPCPGCGGTGKVKRYKKTSHA